jgi:aerobic carbon-monoxide dehydrogenase small subunit
MHEWPVNVSVNGQPTEATVEPRLTLADYLRERCGLKGTHLGCEHGACGARAPCWSLRRRGAPA